MPATSTSNPAVSPSARPGMGSILYQGGAAFRVWAPFAAGVSVAGSFNSWAATTNPLASEGNGYWSADVPGVKVGHQYKFIIRNGDQSLWRVNPYAREVVNSVGNAVIHDANFDWSGDDFVTPPWNELVIYEMHVGTFNVVAGGGQPGTFDDVIKRLPYLEETGINAIEIMPVLEFPQDNSWGYNPSHPFAVESALGGPQGLQRLVKAAHARGIAVIMDVVYNHFGPSDLDLWQFDGWTDCNHAGGIYFYDDSRRETQWGPRPDYGRAEVRQYIRDNALLWLNKYRVDGLRFDAVSYIRNVGGNNNDPGGDLPDGWSLLRRINGEIRGEQPRKIVIAEDLKNNEWITKDTGSGGAGFGSQWDAGFVHPIRQAIITGNDAERDMFAVRDALYHRYNGDAFQRVIYTESHDEDANGHQRVPSEIWPGNAGSYFSKKRSTLGAALVFTAPGIPMIFQGQEFLEDEYFRDEDPLDWSRLETFAGIRWLYYDLIRLRRNWHNRTRGLRGQHIHVHHVNQADKVVAFHRWENGGPCDDVIVVANFANQAYSSYALGFPRGGSWKVRFNSDWDGYSEDFGNHLSYDTMAFDGAMDNMPCHGNVGVGPYSVIVLSQDN